MHRPQVPTRVPLRQLPGTVLLVLALLWAQVLGLAHGVLHFHAHSMPSLATGLPHEAGHDPEHEGHGLLAHLLAPADDGGECRLYDQLGQEGGPPLQLLTVPSLSLPLIPAWVVLQSVRPRPCVAFAARAPPLSR